MSIVVGDIIENSIRILLRDTDEGGTQWLDPELIEWLNEACGEVVRIRPEASSQTKNIALSPGAMQSVTNGSTLLLEAVCNVDASDNEGRAVRKADRHTLDNENYNWMLATRKPVVQRVVPSSTDPRTFYVYPPNDGTGKLRVVESAPPTQVTALTDQFPLPDVYRSPVVNYVCFRAHLKLLESPESQSRAGEFMSLFKDQMGITDRSQEGRGMKARQPTVPERDRVA